MSTHNFEVLSGGILALSVSKVWVVARTEWDLFRVQQLTEDDEPETCLCTHHPIMKLCFIRNRLNGNETMVGCVCVEEFLGMPSNRLFTAMRALVGASRPSGALVDFVSRHKLLGPNDLAFLRRSRGRIWNDAQRKADIARQIEVNDKLRLALNTGNCQPDWIPPTPEELAKQRAEWQKAQDAEREADEWREWNYRLLSLPQGKAPKALTLYQLQSDEFREHNYTNDMIREHVVLTLGLLGHMDAAFLRHAKWGPGLMDREQYAELRRAIKPRIAAAYETGEHQPDGEYPAVEIPPPPKPPRTIKPTGMLKWPPIPKD